MPHDGKYVVIIYVNQREWGGIPYFFFFFLDFAFEKKFARNPLKPGVKRVPRKPVFGGLVDNEEMHYVYAYVDFKLIYKEEDEE